VIDATSDGVYEAVPPQPANDHWTGYFVSVTFPGDTDPNEQFLPNHYIWTTPSYTWPDTLPFKDCHGESSVEIVV